MKIEFRTDNAAFETDSTPEIKRILEDIISKIESGWGRSNIKDINGNIIGYWEL